MVRSVCRADRKGSSDPVMVQPWSESVPTTNDYAGYAVTSGTAEPSLKPLLNLGKDLEAKLAG